MNKHDQNHTVLGFAIVLGVAFFVASLAQATPPITPSGLNTHVSGPLPVDGQTQYNITGGTRPGSGSNLFHSFGDFNVPNNHIANFLNDSGLATSNILGRVNGGNPSNIFGTIQTTGFGNANLFLMNPAGIIFGPNASLNVGGAVTFTTADYLRLADGLRFNAIPSLQDTLLSQAPVAAFGFLQAHPRPITVQGSQLTVAEGTGLSLVGGNIRVQGGTLTAPSGHVNLVSVGSPSKAKVGGEVVIAAAGQGTGYDPSGFATLGSITLSQGSTMHISGGPGAVKIRGGQFVMDASAIQAFGGGLDPAIGSPIDVTAQKVILSNHSRLETGTFETGTPPGSITFNVGSFSATDLTISAYGVNDNGGAVTIQGLQGHGSSATSASLTNTTISTGAAFASENGPILIRADNIALDRSIVSAYGYNGNGGPITLVSSHRITSHDSQIASGGVQADRAGTVDLSAGTSINLTGTRIRATADSGGDQGTISLMAPSISLSESDFNVVTSHLGGLPGTIRITGTKAVSLSNTMLDASSGGPDGGTILINGGALFTSQQSTIAASTVDGHGGTIQIDAAKVKLKDTQITTSVVPETVDSRTQGSGGTITVNAKSTTLMNSKILSTATEGQGGTIRIRSQTLHRDTKSVIDASSQSGTDGTVIIESRH